MGLGQLYNRQWIKGVLFLAIGVLGWYFFITDLAESIRGLITLGDQAGGLVKVGKQFKRVEGDHSVYLMIEGLIAFIVMGIIAFLYTLNVKDASQTGKLRDAGKDIYSFRQTLTNVNEKYFPFIILFLPIIVTIFLTVLPLVFSILIAFTNFGGNNLPPGKLVDWTGFKTFLNLVQLKTWSRTFAGVLSWTLIWAVIATVTTYFAGILVALLIEQPRVRLKKLWRTVLIIPFAIPNLVSLLVMRNLFNNQFGPINDYLRMFGLQGLPWLTDPFWAKITVILVNMWIGIPVSMILVCGVLTTIPRDMYEAAEVDGANPFQKFKNITMPFVLFATAPILIMQFAGNINNFNVIFLLTNGDPVNPKYQYAGSTDLLITWLYKLTLNNQEYNFASALGIIIFVMIATFSIYNFRKTKSFKEEDMIQ
ncbi:carbohydrate ABC transporter permease [Paenibacillus alkalitolerans]|uniref:carbohydrate ABC transporter permease n=1 Tax=Paenibacillus alkalitolerans TaxID=2799335 RepID=UPI001F1A611E|nr:sugar ABC transporter permease [Paenibacillus alkalitolerans]